MASPSPLIAVPTYHLPAGRVLGWSSAAFGLPGGYVASLCRAGARPVLLPPAGVPPEEALEPFAGLLLAGGGDVDPARYGARRHPESYGVDPLRDEAEVGLVRAAMAMGRPTLAICRGLQVLNVALGGTLHQHLPDHQGLDIHGHPLTGASVIHEVKVAPATRLAEAGRSEVLRCTSHHHQGIDRLGHGLVPVAWSGDGLVEGVELSGDDRRWLVGVQWHPETTAAEDPDQQALFDALVERARAAH